MCRNIRTLFNFAPPATAEEVHAASLQFIRKIAGSTRPSKANETAFRTAVERVEAIVQGLLEELVTTAPPKDRDAEAAKARLRVAKRFGVPTQGEGAE